jgi:hypothetical protein
MTQHLFQYAPFVSAAGLNLLWKIECDALTDEDLECIVKVALPSLFSFKEVYGVPRGGVRIAEKFQPHCDPMADCVLIVDDVWTTGKSLYNFRNTLQLRDPYNWQAFVIFARGSINARVKAMFKTEM